MRRSFAVFLVSSTFFALSECGGMSRQAVPLADDAYWAGILQDTPTIEPHEYQVRVDSFDQLVEDLGPTVADYQHVTIEDIDASFESFRKCTAGVDGRVTIRNLGVGDFQALLNGFQSEQELATADLEVERCRVLHLESAAAAFAWLYQPTEAQQAAWPDCAVMASEQQGQCFEGLAEVSRKVSARNST